MSTTFAVKYKGNYINVAFRSNGIRLLNDLLPLLSKQRRVYATDNTQQGIYTVGDILKEIK